MIGDSIWSNDGLFDMLAIAMNLFFAVVTVFLATRVLRDYRNPKIPMVTYFAGIVLLWIGIAYYRWLKGEDRDLSPAMALLVVGFVAWALGGVWVSIENLRQEWRSRERSATLADFEVGKWTRFGLWPFVPTVVFVVAWILTHHWAPLLLSIFFGSWTLFLGPCAFRSMGGPHDSPVAGTARLPILSFHLIAFFGVHRLLDLACDDQSETRFAVRGVGGQG